MIVNRLNKVVIVISKLFNIVALIAVFAMMVMVVSNVVFRLFGSPIKATIDYIEFLAVIGTSFALAYCGVKEGHISISLFMDKLPPKLQKIIDIIINMVSAVLLFIVAWNVAIYANDKFESGDVSITTGTPQAPFIYLLSAGIALLALVVLCQLLIIMFKNGDEDK